MQDNYFSYTPDFTQLMLRDTIVQKIKMVVIRKNQWNRKIQQFVDSDSLCHMPWDRGLQITLGIVCGWISRATSLYSNRPAHAQYMYTEDQYSPSGYWYMSEVLPLTRATQYMGHTD